MNAKIGDGVVADCSRMGGFHGGLVVGAVCEVTEGGSYILVLPRKVDRIVLAPTKGTLHMFSDEIIAVLPGGGTEYLAGKEMV